MNLVTITTLGTEPAEWHRAEWVAIGAGLAGIRYETHVDLTIVLGNLAIAGALAEAYRHKYTVATNTTEVSHG